MQYKQIVAKIVCKAKDLYMYTKKAVRLTAKKVIRPVLGNTVKFLKHSPRVLAALIAVVILVSSTVTVVFATGATAGYSVMHDGEVIATIKDAKTLAEAEILAAQKINNTVCSSKVISPNLVQTIATEGEIKDSKQLADILINRSDEIVTATVLKINGKNVAKGENISQKLDAYLADYKVKNNLQAVEFCYDMQVQTVYTLKADEMGLPTIDTFLNSENNLLAVQTVSTITVTEAVSYKTVQTKSNKYTVGTTIVTKKGVKGSAEVTYKVSTYNGKVTKKTKIASKVLTKPSVQEEIVGTKRIIAADKNGNAPMLWPVKRVERSYVSSYFGDGRGHKGMDICAPKGTPIYAAEAGTVTTSGWSSSGYGYRIIIKHKNGLETLYAHCSALYVKVGDTVSAGETIAAVGTTGRSTGNHLHFEVHKNGKFQNPANYIGSN